MIQPYPLLFSSKEVFNLGMLPKNGLYLTALDNVMFEDDFNRELRAYTRVNSLDIPSETEDKVLAITFVVTESCNLNCTYCYETHKTNRAMTREVGKRAIDFILTDPSVLEYFDKKEPVGIILDFFGGEAFLQIELIDYMVEYFRKRSIELNLPFKDNYLINIGTNGVLYFDEKVQDFLNRNQSNINLNITIDGNKELHDKCRLFHDGRGSYDIVEKAVLDWNNKHVSNTTKITVAPENVEYLFEAVKHSYSLGVTFAYANCCYEEGWKVEHAQILYKELKKLADYLIDNDLYANNWCSFFDDFLGGQLVDTKNYCGGNGSMLAIGTDGKCYSCTRFMQYCLNNQNEKTIGDIWNGIDSEKDNCWLCELKKIDMVTQCQFEDNKKCLDCPISIGCGLCTGYNYDYYGDPNHKATFICDTHRARILANVYFWNKLYKRLNLSKSFPLNLDKETALRIISEEEYDMLKEMGDR